MLRKRLHSWSCYSSNIHIKCSSICDFSRFSTNDIIPELFSSIVNTSKKLLLTALKNSIQYVKLVAWEPNINTAEPLVLNCATVYYSKLINANYSSQYSIMLKNQCYGILVYGPKVESDDAVGL